MRLKLLFLVAVAAGAHVALPATGSATIHPIVVSFLCATETANANAQDRGLEDVADPPGQTPGYGWHSDQSTLRAIQSANENAFRLRGTQENPTFLSPGFSNCANSPLGGVSRRRRGSRGRAIGLEARSQWTENGRRGALTLSGSIGAKLDRRVSRALRRRASDDPRAARRASTTSTSLRGRRGRGPRAREGPPPPCPRFTRHRRSLPAWQQAGRAARGGPLAAAYCTFSRWRCARAARCTRLQGRGRSCVNGPPAARAATGLQDAE